MEEGKIKKFVMILVALCLVAGMSEAAWAQTYLNLQIDWNGIPQNEIIDEVVILFKDNGGVTLLAGELFFDFESGDYSFWSNSFNVPPLAVSVEWFIDPGDDFNPWGDEVPLPVSGFFTDYLGEP